VDPASVVPLLASVLGIGAKAGYQPVPVDGRDHASARSGRNRRSRSTPTAVMRFVKLTGSIDDVQENVARIRLASDIDRRDYDVSRIMHAAMVAPG
jgi:hypothetical protein